MTVAAATRIGSGTSNQDRFLTTANGVCVIDGASAERRQQHDGGWYSQKLKASLHQRLTGTHEGLEAVLSAAIGDVAAQMQDDRPSAAVGMARWHGDALDLVILGDITAVVYLNTGQAEAICDDRLELVAPDLRARYHDDLRTGHGFGAKHRATLAELQTAQQSKRNTADGYWIAEYNPEAAAHALHRTLPLDDVDAVLLASDGIAAAINQYGLFDWDQARDIITRYGPDDLIDRICRAEYTDPAGRRWPRSKPQDDKTLTFVTFSSAQ